MSTKTSSFSPAATTILKATGIAGTFDILSAFLAFGVLFGSASPPRILKGIAGAVQGKGAMDGGLGTELLGLFIHYSITLVFAAFFFVILPFVPFLKKNKIVGGVLYGLFVYVVMNMIVLPMIGYSSYHFRWVGFLENVIILIYAIGIPISIIVHKHYSKKNH
jgi:uncharacterized membrane protein YagU involved in acid resistance